jgi:hypothetical protein
VIPCVDIYIFFFSLTWVSGSVCMHLDESYRPMCRHIWNNLWLLIFYKYVYETYFSKKKKLISKRKVNFWGILEKIYRFCKSINGVFFFTIQTLDLLNGAENCIDTMTCFIVWRLDWNNAYSLGTNL